MGVVYLVHNKLMGRDEVLKVIGPDVMDRPGVLDRFVREIRAVAQLRHPNIVMAYHATRLGESIVFAMEYVPGLDLSRTLKATGPMPVANACYFAHQTALGLQHAHDEGLVHRDIKPGNLMLTHTKDKAMIKILDFGIAKLTREQKIDFQLTSEGQAMGTPDYISPEQIINATCADIRSDIYSLGGTLYHLLTGRPPFQTNSLYDAYQAHISRDADLLNLVRSDVPAELAVVVAKMMAKDPDQRFQTPREVSQALKPMFRTGGLNLGITGTGVSPLDGRAVATEPAGESTSPAQSAISQPPSAARSASGPIRVPAERVDVPFEDRATSGATHEPMVDRSTSERPAWNRWPVRGLVRVEPGASRSGRLRGHPRATSRRDLEWRLTFGPRGAALDEARLSSMGVVFAVVGMIVGSLLGGRQIHWRDHFAVGVAGGLFGVLIAAIVHALIQSIEPALAPLSSSLGAVGMLWAALGAVMGLLLAVVIPHHLDSLEMAR